jgi:hypothetical protein
MISSKAWVKKNGLMVVVSPVNTKTVRSMVMGSLSGQTEPPMRVNGRSIRCMARAFFVGWMGACSKEFMRMTRSMAMEFSVGLMVGPLRDIGRTANRSSSLLGF